MLRFSQAAELASHVLAGTSGKIIAKPSARAARRRARAFVRRRSLGRSRGAANAARVSPGVPRPLRWRARARQALETAWAAHRAQALQAQLAHALAPQHDASTPAARSIPALHLPTHAWHAKRARLEPRFGWQLPARMAGYGISAALNVCAACMVRAKHLSFEHAIDLLCVVSPG